MPHLLHQRFAERVQPRLRGAVGGAADEGVLARQAADVDDPAAATGAQLRNGGVAAVEHAGQVRLDHAQPVVIAHVGDVRERADARVVHQDVHAAEPLHGGGNQPVDIGAQAHVGAYDLEPVRVCGQRLACPVQVLLAQAADDNARALFEQRRGDRQSDAARAAGHDCDPGIEM